MGMKFVSDIFHSPGSSSHGVFTITNQYLQTHVIKRANLFFCSSLHLIVHLQTEAHVKSDQVSNTVILSLVIFYDFF